MPASNDELDLNAKADSADDANPTPRLALRPKEACAALSIGPRLLWSLTNQNLVPHVRLGRAVVYPVDDLRRWLSEQAQKKGGRR